MHAISTSSLGIGTLTIVIALMLLIVLLPFCLMTYYSLTDLSFSLPGRTGHFIGLSNFKQALTDSRFWESLLLTVQFAILAIPIELVIGLIVSLALPIRSPCGRLLIPLLVVPLLFSGIAVGLVWRLLLHGDYGLLVYYLRAFGLIGNRSLLGSPTSAFACVLLVDIWQWTPFCAMVLLAARTGIARSLYNSAKLDGAGPLRTFFDITLPGLRHALLVCLLFRTTDCLREFDKIWALTNGGPGTRTELISVYLFKASFEHGDQAYGSALSLLIYIVVIACTNTFLWIVWKKQNAS
jgi:multiple sugar transport system permease protein